MKEIIVNIDNYNENSIKTIEGDNLSEVYKIYICKNKRRIDLTNKIAIMAYVNEYGNKKSNILALNITNASQGEIELPITNVISSENGVYACQVAIYGENNSLEQTAPFSLIVENNIFSKISNTAINSSDFHILSEAIKTTNSYAEKLKEGTENIELQYADKLHEINSGLSSKADHNEVRLKDVELTLNDFDESSRNILQGQQKGNINSVLGGQNVTKDNIKIGGIDPLNIYGCNPVNVFNKKLATYGKYLTPSGTVGINKNFCYSDFIPCQVNDIFEIIGVNGENNTGGICGGVVYNSFKEVIGSFTTYKPNWVVAQGSSNWNNVYKVTQPNAYFVRFNILASSINNMKMVTKNFPYRNEDGSISPYVPYGKTKIDWLDLDDIFDKINKTNENLDDSIEVLNEINNNLSKLSTFKIELIGETVQSHNSGALSTNFYGFMNRIANLKKPIKQISLYTKSIIIGGEYHCKLWNDELKEELGYAKAVGKKDDGTIEKIDFIFDKPITISDENFYVSIYSSDDSVKISTASKLPKTPICTATEEKSNKYFNKPSTSGTTGYVTNPKDEYYMDMEFYFGEYNLLPLDNTVCLNKLTPDIRELLGKEGNDKTNLELFIPKKIFTWGDGINGDFNGDRVPNVGLYLDHMLPWGIYDLNISFDNSNQRNKITFTTPYPIDWNISKINNGNKKQNIEKTFKIKGQNYNELNATITQVSVTNDVGADNHVALLTIGDSTVEGANAFITLEDGTQIWSPFWNEVARQFAMDSIEANDEEKYRFSSLGVRSGKGGSSTVEYLGKTRKIITATNGESGSKLADHLRYVAQKRPSQETWDKLGLGNGTGIDYKGTSKQKDLIAQTCETYSGTESEYNGNPFFDNSKVGDNKFSIAKWLERYRTLDDNGNRLTLGNGTGTKITNDNINKINVCTPTHVLLQTGLNDWSQVSVEQYIKDMDIFVREIKNQLPDCKIAITLFPDDPGTYFKELYPNIEGSDMRYLHDKTRPYVTALFEHFKDSVDVELLPFYFVMPPAISLSYRWIQNDDGEKIKTPFGPASNDYHSNGYAHKAWGHQLYAWIKSTLI